MLETVTSFSTLRHEIFSLTCALPAEFGLVSTPFSEDHLASGLMT